MPRRPNGATLGLLIIALCGACAHRPQVVEIGREQAIMIARQEVSFVPDRVDAVRTMSHDRPVWRVTLRGRLPGQPPLLFETAIVDIDRASGRIVSIART